MSKITIEDFGKFVIHADGGAIRLVRRKSQAIMTVLAHNRDHTEIRAVLSTLLWSQACESGARTNLRQEISHIRAKAVAQGTSLVGSDKEAVWLAADAVQTGSGQVLVDLAALHVPDLLLNIPIPQEHLFAHLDGLDPELDLWIAVQRARFERMCSEAILSIIHQEKSPTLRKRASAALLSIDPTNATAIRAQVECLREEGAIARARAALDSYRKTLVDEYGLRPAPDIEALSTSLESGGTPSDKRPAQMASPSPNVAASRPLIIAQPFDAKTSQTGDALESMRIILLGALARFRDWSVRESYPTGTLAMPERWFELRFSGFEQDGVPLLFTSLSAMPENEILWSDRVLCSLSSGDDTSKATIRTLAASLNLEISARRIENALSRSDKDRNVHDRWLLAQQHLLSWRAKDETEAETAIRAILARWPHHAPSLTSLVEILNTRHHIFPGVLPDMKRSQEALQLARRAARTAPRDSRIQLALGWSHLMVKRPEQANHHFAMALQLNDNDPLTLISAAMGICYCGDHERACDVAQQALEAGAGGEPIHWAYHACIRYYCDDFDGAQQAAAMSVGSAYYVTGLRAAIAGRAGDRVAAKAFVDQFMKELAANWYSSKNPTTHNVRQWLVESFPITLVTDRTKLEAGLDAAGLR